MLEFFSNRGKAISELSSKRHSFCRGRIVGVANQLGNYCNSPKEREQWPNLDSHGTDRQGDRLSYLLGSISKNCWYMDATDRRKRGIKENAWSSIVVGLFAVCLTGGRNAIYNGKVNME